MNAAAWMQNAVLWVHIDAGVVALIAGTIAVAMRKGGKAHAGAGRWFVGAMLVLGITAVVLGRLTDEGDTGLGGLFTCYFVLTSWVAARRRDGAAGKFEMGACVFAFGTAAILVWAAFSGAADTPAGAAPLYAFAVLCALAGVGDLRAVLRGRLTPAQRLSRHLWRMCLAFFIATGSFFIGQQDVMPAEVRGSPLLFVLGFAPFAVMAFWLVKIRFGKALARLISRSPAGQPGA